MDLHDDEQLIPDDEIRFAQAFKDRLKAARVAGLLEAAEIAESVESPIRENTANGGSVIRAANFTDAANAIRAKADAIEKGTE